MTTGKLAERIRDDIEQQAVASTEALRYWKGRGMPQSESYWEGWRDRGGAVAQAIRLKIGPKDFDEATRQLLKEKDELLTSVRNELKETQSRLKAQKQKCVKLNTEARLEYVKRLIATGGRINVTTHEGATWYYIMDDGKKQNIPYAVIERLEKEGFQYDLWSTKLKKAA